MRLQGDLQVIFNALDELGVVRTMLVQDWQSFMDEMNPLQMEDVITEVNACSSSPAHLVKCLKSFKGEYLCFLTIEVARELVLYYSQSESSIH